MMIVKLLGLGRSRQLHTIISRDIIKPSSPTPSHLKTYNLSPLDQLADRTYSPLVLFYPNNGNFSMSADDKARQLKKSLSETLTQYYPFAGSLPTLRSPYVDCNDEGAVFVEASNDSPLETFYADDGPIEELFPDGLVGGNSPFSKIMLGAQLNHFSCGGVGLAVSLSHIISDACSVGTFMNHWSLVSRYGSPDHEEILPLNPHFIQSPRTNSIMPEAPVIHQRRHVDRVMRRFVFPNTKLSDLKNKVIALASAGSSTPPINNPTRVEVLTSLLYKTAIETATTKSGSFTSSSLLMTVNLRNKFDQKLPLTTFGNFSTFLMVPTRHEYETSLNVTVTEIKKEKSKLDQGVENVQHAAENLKSLQSKLGNVNLADAPKRSYVCSSVCGYPLNKVDFGWGKPTGSTLAYRSANTDGFLLQDTLDGDGIEALVFLEKEYMEIFENDKDMLSFCHI